MASNAATPPRSPFSVTFLLHIIIEFPFAVQALWAPHKLPFLDMTNTTIIITKLYGSLLLASCFAAFLCWTLPEFFPGKRAFGLSLLLYHSIATTALFSSERFIPISFGSGFERLKFTPETLWGGVHAVLSLTFAAWWQMTLAYSNQMFKKTQ